MTVYKNRHIHTSQGFEQDGIAIQLISGIQSSPKSFNCICMLVDSSVHHSSTKLSARLSANASFISTDLKKTWLLGHNSG